MTTRRRVWLVLLVGATVWAGSSVAATAQGIAPERAERVGARGLPHRSVLALLEDRDGFLWIGTADGLARFDGYEILVFRHDPLQPEGLSSSTVTTLLEDRRAVLWIGTENGVHRFDRVRNIFERLEQPGAGGDVAVSCALEDRSGMLWFGTARSGLLAVDQSRGTLLRHGQDGEPGSIRHDHVRAIHEDAEGDLWVLSCSVETCCLQRRAAGPGFETVLADIRPTDLWALHADRRRAIWVDPCGPLELTEGRPETTTTHDCAIGRGTWTIVPATQDHVWMGTGEGLFRVDTSARMTEQIQLGQTARDFLATFVRALHLGRSDILWIGTHSGLYAADPRAKRFHHWDLRRRQGDGDQATSAVSSLLEVSGGDLFVGTYGGGLLRLDRSGSILDRYGSQPDAAGTLPSDVVWALATDDRENLWIAAHGLVRLDLRSGEMSNFQFAEGFGPTFVVADPTDGRLWLASFRGLVRFDPTTGEHESVGFAQDGREIAVQSVLLDAGDSLWVGTAESLFHLDLDSDTVREVPLESPDGASLRGTGTWVIHPAGDGSLWLGTSVGLVHYSAASDEVDLVSLGHGLPGSSVYSILEDDGGVLWLGTNQGLTRFDPLARDEARCRNFSVDEGLGNVEFNRHAAWSTSDGALFFGGLDGLTWFRPDEIRSNTYVPPVRLTHIEVLGGDGSRQVNPYGLERLVLSPDDVSFSFEFAALSFTNPQRNRYAYRLEGLDPRWIEAGYRRFAQYTRVEPGKYTFHVRGANNDGVWNTEGVSIPVVIRPAFWQTLWFRLAMLAVVAGAVFAAYSYRMAQVRKLQKLRLDLAGDLHDDLSSDLAGVAVVADMMRGQSNLEQRQHADLEMIRDTARRLVDGVRDIVWYMDPEHDSFDAAIDRMRGVAERLLRGTTYKISAKVPKRAPELSMEARRDVFLVYKEALQNVARHAHAETVDIVLSIGGRRLCLEVSDDGVGFDPDDAAAGHGLRSMRRRAEQIGAKLEIDSRPGDGTCVRLELDLARFRDGTASRRDVG